MENRQNEYFDATQVALDDLRKQYNEKYKTKAKSLSNNLDKAAKANDEVLTVHLEMEALGFKVENFAWRELCEEQALAASRLATWQRSLSEFLES